VKRPLSGDVAREALVQRVCEIIRCRNADLYGLYVCNEELVRSMTHSQLLKFVADN